MARRGRHDRRRPEEKKSSGIYGFLDTIVEGFLSFFD
jgi:hypothetical protein